MSKLFSAVPIGLWYFRKGEVSKSLSTLARARVKPQIALGYIEQGKDIQRVLSKPLPAPLPGNNNTFDFNGKVLFACHSSGKFHPNGYAIRTNEIAGALSNLNVSVTAITRPGYPWDLPGFEHEKIILKSEFRGLYFEHLHDPLNMINRSYRQYIMAYAKHLEGMARSVNASVIHAHSNYLNGLAAQQACVRNGWRSIYEIRGLWHLTRASKESGYLNSEHFQFCEHMEVSAALTCDRVVTLNKSMRNWLVDKGVPSQKITIIPNGTEKRKTPIISKEKPGELVIGYAGALTEYEGVDNTIKAIALLYKKDLRVKFLIAGHGDQQETLKTLSKKLGISSELSFLGHLSGKNLERFYDSVDIVVLARKNLPVSRLVPPLKLMEAFAHGKAVIVTNLPPLTEILHQENCGIVVDSGSPRSLSEAIAFLINSPNERIKMSQKALKVANDRFLWSNLVQKYVDVYQCTDTINGAHSPE